MTQTLRQIVLGKVTGRKFAIRDPLSKELNGRTYTILDIIEGDDETTFLEIKYEDGKTEKMNFNYLSGVSELVGGRLAENLSRCSYCDS